MKCIFETMQNTVGSYAKVYSPNRHGEYTVRVYNRYGIMRDVATYFASFKDDAINTALAMTFGPEYSGIWCND